MHRTPLLLLQFQAESPRFVESAGRVHLRACVESAMSA